MHVKICGITNLEDAQMAADAGADYLGFIFYPPSKRAIEPEAARDITAVLRSRTDCPLLVGVFVNETAEAIVRILDQCRLDLVQLSGDEVPFMVGDERSPIFGRAYKALRPASLSVAEAEAEWYLSPQWKSDQSQLSITNYQLPITNHQSPLPPPSLLIDTYHPTLRGGTGETGDWAISARLARDIPGLMLAGGLTAENVAAAVRQVRPFAVDVASGVEAYPGKKNPDLVRAFIRNAKKIDNSPSTIDNMV
ncbi:MAG: N-(5'-phosphoribosyl)anthranilate isomerase [Anaerolineae bacterium]